MDNQKYAKELLDSLNEIYSERHEYQPVNPKDFPHLDRKFYDKMASILEANGFMKLGDIEDVTVTRASPYLHRTFLRCLVSSNGTISAGIFDAKPKGFMSIIGWLLGSRREKVTEFETEFSNGCFIYTTHAQAVQHISLPLEIIPQYLSKKTSPTELLRSHQKKVTQYLKQHPDVQPIVIRSLEEGLESQHRAEVLKSVHRQSLGGGVTLKELKDIAKESNGANLLSQQTATQLFTEMQKLQEPDKPSDIAWEMLPSLPENWQDIEEWEKHYASLSASEFLEEHQEDLLAPFADIEEVYQQMLVFMDSNDKTIWFPGCGFSYLPKLFAECGFRVHATDISKTAIQFQQNLNVENLKKQIEKFVSQDKYYEEESSPTLPLALGMFEYAVHDFNNPYQDNYFDAIFNVYAIEGFPQQQKEQIAKIHCASLKPGRFAYFFTMNVSEENRDDLEECLAKGGFFVPGLEVKKWFYNTLKETGISNIIFMGGHPIIERVGEYQHDEPKWYKDMERLDKIFHKSQAKTQNSYENIPLGRKVAIVVDYSNH